MAVKCKNCKDDMQKIWKLITGVRGKWGKMGEENLDFSLLFACESTEYFTK